MLCTKFLHRWQPKIHMVPPMFTCSSQIPVLKQRNGSFFSFSDAQSGRKCAQLARRNNSASCIVIDRGQGYFVSIICSKQPNISSLCFTCQINVLWVLLFRKGCLQAALIYKSFQTTINGASEQFLHCH